MGLGLNQGGGDFTPFVKYNAKAGRWYNKDEEGNEYELKADKLVFYADLDNVEVGWIKFGAPGVAPEFAFAPASEGPPARPSADHKSGFRMRLYSEPNLHGLREWSASSALVNGAMNELYDLFEAEVGNHAGECPVIRCYDTEPVTSKHGTNYKPLFEIVGWKPRPAAFDGAEAEAPKAAPAKAKAATPPPPPRQPVSAMEEAEF
jgi:hypothetical protein